MNIGRLHSGKVIIKYDNCDGEGSEVSCDIVKIELKGSTVGLRVKSGNSIGKWQWKRYPTDDSEGKKRLSKVILNPLNADSVD